VINLYLDSNQVSSENRNWFLEEKGQLERSIKVSEQAKKRAKSEEAKR